MTGAEREAYVRRIVDAAPPLCSEDADSVRRLMPLHPRLATRSSAPRPRPVSTTAA